MTFRVGQKVVYIGCKRSIWHAVQRYFHPYEEPVKGRVYTVSNAYTNGDDLLIEILEFPSPADGYWDAGFLAIAFRPIVERKTDISIFTKMLKQRSEVLA